VKPLVVCSNWVTEPRNPGFVIEHKSYSSLPEQDSLYHTLSHVQRKDKDGLYTEICFVFRLPIDASFLRACKDFYSIGNAMLYGDNEFSFDMVNPYHHKSPPTMLGTFKNHEEWQPDPRKPHISPDNVWKATYDIERHVQIKGLTPWVYYDHFLRWLYIIGPKNAALVKALKFQGTAKLHHCQMDEDESEFPCFNKPCDDSIIDSLQIYIPFIRKFCTGLEKLTLIVEKDNWAKKNPQDIIDDGFPEDREAALRPLLEKEIPKIESLKELIVLGGREDTEQLNYAKPVTKLLRKRAQEREILQNEKDKAWAEARPFVPVIAAAGKTGYSKKQHLKPIADLQVVGMDKIQVRENAKQIAPVVPAAGKTELCRRFRSVLDLRFGNAEKVEVPHSYFRRDKN
jgi:hypothetical protein